MPEAASRAPIVLVTVLLVALSILAALVVGRAAEPAAGLGWVLASAVYAGGPAIVYIVASLGYGRLLGRIVLRGVRGEAARAPAEAAVGMGFLLSVSHGLGALGWLTPAVAVGVCVVGVAGAVWAFVRGREWRAVTVPAPFLWLCLPAVGVLLVAASCAPGWIWDSEYGGYDVLSYHLPIVQEWIARGRIEPLEHNVYSYLPGLVESAFFHLAMLTGAPAPGDAGGAWGLIAGDGWRVLGAQWLHAMMTLWAAWIVAGATRAIGERAGLDAGRGRIAGAVAGAVVLATPWVVVVGSMAYNEMAVVGLGAGALAATMLLGLRPLVRGVIVGVLMGAACGAKPTAILMVAPAVGLFLLAQAPRRQWAAMCLAGAAAGALTLAPWMIRNALHGGNPVFPYATGLFGTAHWTHEQAERFAGAHRFDGSMLDRLRLAVWANPAVGPGARTVEVFRGLTNPQWGGLFLFAAAAGVWGVARAAGRRMAALLVAGLGVQLLAWLLATHIQSRFLIPCVVTAGSLIGVVCGGFGRRRAALVAGAAVVAVQAGATLWIWCTQAGGHPTAAMIDGVRLFRGEPFVAGLHEDMATPVTNRVAGGEMVYLLGGATPLYLTAPVLYHTTWDTSPLGELMRAGPGEPMKWAAALRARGVRFVLADYGELDRLGRSGWYDRAVTSGSAKVWLDVAGEPVAAWPGRVLYRLRDAAGGGR